MIPRSRGESLSWACSLALHLPLFLWQGGPLASPELPLTPLEISVGSEAELSPAASVGDPGGASGEPDLPRSRAASGGGPAAAPARSNPWEGFKASGLWNKLGGGGGASGGSSADAREALQDGVADHGWPSKLPQGWEAKKTPTRQLLPGGGGAGEGPVKEASDGPSSLSASPWGGGASASRGSGKLAGGEAVASASSFAGGSSRGIPDSNWDADGGQVGGSGGKSGFRQGGGTGGALFEMRGPVARRSVIRSILPRYPDWAKEQGFEANVTVYFVVLPDGGVKTPILVRKTSGDPRLDAIVLETLERWRFAPLSAGRKEEQWGLLTFRFRLQE